MKPSFYKHYLLVVLLVILASNYVDRFALGFLLQSIKVDLVLSDTQLGFLTGIAFALFYAFMGIPIARWADRGNRVTIISLTTALWGIAVALSGAAVNFTQLLLIRIGIAVGEAGCQPPALSLISDYFSRDERPRAVARYMLGLPLALMTASFGAGWLNELFGWRTTFIILGVPGLVLAAIAWLTLKEPRVSAQEQTSQKKNPTSSQEPSLRVVFVTLWANPAFRHLLLCFSLTSFFAYGILQWQPAFFVRSYKVGTGELGTWFALIYGVGGLLGTYIGGELTTRYAAKNERLQLAGIAVLYAALAVVKATVYLVPDYYLAFAALAISSIGGAAGNGPIFAATQTLVPPQMRAMSIALILFFSNLIGMGLGPLAAGVLSDWFYPVFGDESLRYALLVLCPGYFAAAWFAWKASQTARDAATAFQDGDGPPPTDSAIRSADCGMTTTIIMPRTVLRSNKEERVQEISIQLLNGPNRREGCNFISGSIATISHSYLGETESYSCSRLAKRIRSNFSGSVTVPSRTT